MARFSTHFRTLGTMNDPKAGFSCLAKSVSLATHEAFD
jgi:hypothetical protein